LADCYQSGIGVEQDLEEAVRLYHLAADQGFESAILSLCDCYLDGTGVEKDAKKASGIFSRSNTGTPPAKILERLGIFPKTQPAPSAQQPSAGEGDFPRSDSPQPPQL